MTRAELQRRINHIEATIEYKLREVMELIEERRQLQAHLVGEKTLDAVAEMAEDDIRRLLKSVSNIDIFTAQNGKAIVKRFAWQYPDIRYSTKTEAEVMEGVPTEIALAAALRYSAGLPIPSEYRPFLKRVKHGEG